MTQKRRWMLRIVLALLGLAPAGVRATAAAPSPPPYVKQATWHETMLASRDALVRRERAAPAKPKERAAAREALWERVKLDFAEAAPRREMRWARDDRILDRDWEPGDRSGIARRYADACRRVPALARKAEALMAGAAGADRLDRIRALYHRARDLDEALVRARSLNTGALRRAVDDLIDTFGDRYPGGRSCRARLAALDEAVRETLVRSERREPADLERLAGLVAGFEALRREALLANPLLDFDRLLLVRRVPDGDPRRAKGRGYSVGEYIGLPRQSSKCHPNIERPCDWENDIAVLSPVRPDGRIDTRYRPDGRRLATDLDLHWDGDRMLFSMPDANRRWQVFEIGADGRGLRQVTPGDQPDVHSYDACYLPDGRIAFVSTAPLQGVPCNAGVIVGMLYAMDADGTNIRQLAFEQDHSYCPSVTNDGRILYLRWDYTDTPHVWNRVLFTMNPDGTGQAEYYGSNSYWPNGIFFARAVPGHPTMVAGIVTGHHVGRVGDLILFDPALGRFEADGVVQRIPGYGRKVEPVIEDRLTQHTFPKFLHPYPLSEKHFLVSCKPSPDALWGLYLVDVYDNAVLLREQEGHALLEPIPLRAIPVPPVIQDRTDPGRKDADVAVEDIYAGPGLRGVPRGTVKKLRIFTYHFGYQRLAGIDHRVGADGPWEVKRVLGTVPVEADGSAFFRIPAKTPVSIQPLDARGQALQLMRSWMTAMPGEVVSCIGCHEKRDSAPINRPTLASRRPPSTIEPWHGPVRGFSFDREVQPVLDRYCVGCHDDRSRKDGGAVPDLRGGTGVLLAYRHGDPQLKRIRGTPIEGLMKAYKGIFPPSYIALRRLVRVGGLESDLHLLPAKEFHAETSELVQMLRKGHHGVRLDAEAWDRLVTWIDLNAPCHGTWSEFTRIAGPQRERRRVLRRLYGGVDEDPEEIPAVARPPVEPVVPDPEPEPEAAPVDCAGWPFDPAEAARRKEAAPADRVVDLGGGVTLSLVGIPAGRFVMGDPDGDRDERPLAQIGITRPFLLGRCEVTNAQYARFDPSHDSRFEHRTSWIFSEEYLGWPLNRPSQPVVRVSWQRAMAFCRWLSDRTGLAFTLPTEAQWEYACRAGTAGPLWFGDLDTDFSRFANMADHTIRDLAYTAWRPLPPDIVPRDARFDDGMLVTADVGSYRPNAWGLHDMHGNAWEWTRSAYGPYPYRADDGRNDVTSAVPRVVRGGSWYDRPRRCRSAFRLSYPPYQRIYNVGFRVVCEPAGSAGPGSK